MENNVANIKNILARSVWSNQDIMDYVGCGKTIASKIHQLALKEHNGYVAMCPKKIKRDAVLKVLDVSFHEEASKLRILEGV
jgi:hypothetical protein